MNSGLQQYPHDMKMGPSPHWRRPHLAITSKSPPPTEQARMLDMLKQADPDNYGWWFETLVGKMPEEALNE